MPNGNAIDASATGQFQPLFRSLDEIARYEPKVEGIKSGLPHLDKLTGGLRPNKLNFIVGYSHHGKTHMMLRYLINNLKNDMPCLFISGDDTDDILLCKIIAMLEGVKTEDVEAWGPEWRAQYQEINLRHKLVIAATRDDYLTTDLDNIFLGAQQHLSEINGVMTEPALIGFDYVSILRVRSSDNGNGFNDVGAKIHAIKKLIRSNPDAVWMVGHQCRKSAADATALSLNDLEYGGHQQADGVIIGCRRNNMANMDVEQLRDEELCPKVYVSVMKNKVTGRKSSNPAGYPFMIDPVSGYIREIEESDRPYHPNGVPMVKKVTYG